MYGTLTFIVKNCWQLFFIGPAAVALNLALWNSWSTNASHSTCKQNGYRFPQNGIAPYSHLAENARLAAWYFDESQSGSFKQSASGGAYRKIRSKKGEGFTVMCFNGRCEEAKKKHTAQMKPFDPKKLYMVDAASFKQSSSLGFSIPFSGLWTFSIRIHPTPCNPVLAVL